jgi:hypothetical protein
VSPTRSRRVARRERYASDRTQHDGRALRSVSPTSPCVLTASAERGRAGCPARPVWAARTSAGAAAAARCRRPFDATGGRRRRGRGRGPVSARRPDERVHQYRVDRGLPTNGRERYGYLAHRATHTRSDGALRVCPQGCEAGRCQTGFVPDLETAPVVQRIYQAYIGGKGFQAIAKLLNDDGLPTPGRVAAGRSGNPRRIARTATTTCTAGSVIHVADSGFAAGLITHNGCWSPAAHEPLIGAEQSEAYQHRREAQRVVATKARSPKWSLAGLAVCGQCGGKMYCSSSQRGRQYSMYCSTQRTSGACTGTYRTREPVEAAVALGIQGYATELEEATRAALTDAPKPRQDPHQAERRRLAKVIAAADGKLSRLLDAYTSGAPGLDLPEYKRRREAVQQEADQARSRLAQLDEPEAQVPTPATITASADAWPTLSVDARRDVAGALLSAIRVHADKTVELVPRWGTPSTVRFTKRDSIPVRAVE